MLLIIFLTQNALLKLYMAPSVCVDMVIIYL